MPLTSHVTAPQAPAIQTIALVGNPNCGKTTLFNVLTGAWQQVGNWAGVTVERKSGYFTVQNKQIEIIDLPGTYTLTVIDSQGPQDENITSEYLKTNQFSLIVNVVDALHIERNLYLTLQCIEQNLPILIALNRLDLAEKQGKKICIETLAKVLGCQVIPLVARAGIGVEVLKTAVLSATMPSTLTILYPEAIETELTFLEKAYNEISQHKQISRFQLLCWLEGEPIPCHSEFAISIKQSQARIEKQCGHPADVMIAKTRYDWIESTIAKIKDVSKQSDLPSGRIHNHFTQRLDRVVCHRYLGLPLFLGVMYALFFFAINIGGAFQDFFELSARALFIEGVLHTLHFWGAPSWITALLVSGFGEGLTTVVTFIPVIGAMFFALAFLEDCGYMARAAFVVDRLMRAIGLPGKSFVPMIVGFGCNVPAIMGARTLDNKRDRILAVMMSPFMSCGARLAIFTVFVSAFFEHQGGQNIVFLLYLIGIVMAIFTGLLLKKTLLRGEITPLLLEMPDYQIPHWQSLWFHCWHRLRRFVMNAGKLILPVCLCVGILNHLSIQGKWLDEIDDTSLLSIIGQEIVPIFHPLGVEKENWPAAVGLFTGILAKEVVIGTLNALYAKEPEVEGKNREPFHLGQSLKEAVMTIPNNLSSLTQGEPLPEMTSHSHHEMVSRFGGQANAFAYLLFVLLYFPCISATAAMVREVQKGWTLFSVCWTTGLAYAIAVVYYQCATFAAHPWQSSFWIGAWMMVGIATFYGIRFYSKACLPRMVPTPIVLR